MITRRALLTALFQVVVFFLVCYFVALVLPWTTKPVPADNSADTHKSPDIEQTMGTARKCIDCSSPDTNKKGREHFIRENNGNQVKQDSTHNQQTSVDVRTVGRTNSNRVVGSPNSIHNGFNADNVKEVLQNNGHDTFLTHPPQVTSNAAITLNPRCKEPLCMEYLSKEDRSRFDSCVQKVKSNKGHPKDGQCHFMPQAHRVPVALASYPGSGNTWLRGLLETATGICTGFEFCDISMRVKGFAGENIVSGAVSVVKTHGYPHWKNKRRHNTGVHFDSAVVLVRNPLDTFVAEWNRRVANNFRGSTVSLTSHVKSAGKEMFGTNTKWMEFLREQVPRWQMMVKEWVTSHGKHPILVVKYEDLKRNSSLQVKRILTFLQIPYSDKDVEWRLTKGFSSFHRSHKPEFNHYTPAQRQRVLHAINDTIQLLNASRHSHLLDLHEYLYRWT